MPTHRTFLIVAATLLLVMLGIAACVPAGPQAEAEMEEQPMLSMEPAEEQVLRFAPCCSFRWDPATGTGSDYYYGAGLLSALTEVVVNPDTGDEEVTCWLCDTSEVSDDGLTYTYHLRQDLKFGKTGNPVTAHDVKYTWERSLRVGKWPLRLFMFIEGAMDLYNESADTMSGITVLDDFTLEVQMMQPTPMWDRWSTGTPMAVCEQSQLEAGTAEKHWLEDGGGCAGPFQAESLDPDERLLILERNPHWPGEAAKLDRIVIQGGLPVETKLIGYENNEFDVIWISGPVLSEVLDPENPMHDEIRFWPTQNYLAQVLFTDKPPFDDPKMREAFVKSINMDEIIEKVMRGRFIKLKTLTGGHYGAYCEINNCEDRPGLTQDVEGALQAFAESRYQGDPSLVEPIRVYASPGTTLGDRSLLWQAISQQVYQVLGLQIELLIKSRTTPEERELANIGSWAHGMQALDPQEAIWPLWHSDGPFNDGYLKHQDPQLDALIENAQAIHDVEERMAAWKGVEDYMYSLYVMIPTYLDARYFLVKPWVRNFELGYNSRLLHPDEVWIAEH